MARRFYIAVYTDSGMLIGCDHKHKTVASATACISESGGYVVVIRRGKYLSLTNVEELEFQQGCGSFRFCDFAVMRSNSAPIPLCGNQQSK